MVIFILRDLWRTCAGILSAGPLSATRFNTFVVQGQGLANDLRRWIDQDKKSKDAIKVYLDDLVPFYYRTVPLQYSCDHNGRLSRITFSGIVPDGWGPAWPGAHILKPVSPTAIAAVDALPLSSRQALHDLINWPTIQEEWVPREQHILARQVNRLVRPEEKDGRVYIHAPHPENFKESSPVICQTLYGWEMPDTIRKAEMSPKPY